MSALHFDFFKSTKKRPIKDDLNLNQTHKYSIAQVRLVYLIIWKNAKISKHSQYMHLSKFHNKAGDWRFFFVEAWK